MKWLASILSILMAVVFAMGNGCGGPTKAGGTDSLQAEREWHSRMQAWGRENNAFVGWETNIPCPRPGLAFVYCIDVSQALIRSNGQPVLLELDLCDIAEEKGTYVARFLGAYDFSLYIDLKCTTEQVKALLTNDSQEYAVTAQVTEVARPRFKVRGVPQDSVDDVDLNYSTDVFLAKGTCRGLLARRQLTRFVAKP